MATLSIRNLRDDIYKRLGEIADEQDTNTEAFARQLLTKFVERHDDRFENHYTLRGYNADHTRYVEIEKDGDWVEKEEHGMPEDYFAPENLAFRNAVSLVKRGEQNDRVAAIEILEELVGEGRVFCERED